MLRRKPKIYSSASDKASLFPGQSAVKENNCESTNSNSHKAIVRHVSIPLQKQ